MKGKELVDMSLLEGGHKVPVVTLEGGTIPVPEESKQADESLIGRERKLYTPEEIESGVNNISPERWREIAENLWSLLDDIDTATDIYRPQMDGFYKCIMEKVTRRFKYMSSDGYSLFPIKRSKE